MKEFYSLIKGSALVTIVSIGISAHSQSICGPIVENFNNTSGSNAGFFGDFTIGSTGSDGYLNKSRVIASAIYTITTPTYQLASSTTHVGYGFELTGSERVARVESAIIYESTLNNEIITIFLDHFVPSYDQATGAADVCRAVTLTDLPGFPQGGKYRFRFELTPNTGNGQTSQNISFDDFRTNGTLAQAPLPVTFIGFEGRKLSNGTQLTWKVAGEENVNRYEIERSSDGYNFVSIASIATGKKDTYTFLDVASSGAAFYRIKNVDNDGKFKYSAIARIVNGKSSIVIKAFPQPVVNLLTVQHPIIKNNGLLTLSSADGRLVKSMRPATGSMQTSLDMSSMQKGFYMVRFESGDGSIETFKVVKQ